MFDIYNKKNYSQLKQVEIEGRNPEENEIHHPVPPDWNMDKDARPKMSSQNNNSK